MWGWGELSRLIYIEHENFLNLTIFLYQVLGVRGKSKNDATETPQKEKPEIFGTRFSTNFNEREISINF